MIYQVNGKTINFEQVQLMAIVNLTPDSFYDGGKYDGLNDIIADVKQKIKTGANIIDIGAASSRPGAQEITLDEEWKRLEEPLVAIRNEFPEVIISIDTYRSEIASKCVARGADMINDISGGNLDKNMFKTMAELQVPYVLMHMKGTPENMQTDTNYGNLIDDIYNEFESKIKELETLHLKKTILDVGFGFGKNLQQNYQLLKHLNKFNKLGYPILAGVSRKSMINKVIHTNPVTALNGTTVLHTIALLNGAKILRVHDVLEAKQAIELVDFYKNA